MRPRFVQSTSLIFLLFFPPLEMVVCHRSFFSPSRERPSRTSANYDYLQLEISKGRKRRKEGGVDSSFPRVFESISKEKNCSLSIDCFFLLWNFYSFTISNEEYDPNLMIASTRRQRVKGLVVRTASRDDRVDRSAERRLAWLDRRIGGV